MKKEIKPTNIIILSLTIILIIGVLIIGYIISPINGEYINKNTLKENITIAYKKNANLETIKKIFNDKRNIYKNYGIWNIYIIPNILGADYQLKSSIKIDNILNEIKNDLYTEEKQTDKESIEKITKLIKENQKTSPYEVLEENQKTFFKNISIKLKNDEKYREIEDDIENIIKEVEKKNKMIIDIFK